MDGRHGLLVLLTGLSQKGMTQLLDHCLGFEGLND